MNIWYLVFSTSFLFSILRISTPLLLATMGSVISSNSGTLNIVIEGSMLTAAFGGMIISAATQSVIIGVLGAVLLSVLVMCIMALFTLYFNSDPMLCGLAINMFASGGTVFFLYAFTGQKGNSSSIHSLVVPNISIPIIKDIPVLGKVLSGHNVLTYVAILATIAVIMIISRTPYGVRLRAVGLNPNAARSTGINIKKMQFSSWVISGILCGLAGAFMSMGYVSWFTRDMTGGRGWIAIAACILGNNDPKKATLAAFMFAAAEAFANALGLLNLPGTLVATLPYVVTIVVLVASSFMNSKKTKLLKI